MVSLEFFHNSGVTVIKNVIKYYNKSVARFIITLRRHLATSRKVALSIPNGVIGIFHISGVTVIINVINAKNLRANWLNVAATELYLGSATFYSR